MFTIENEYYLRFILLLCDGCSYITKQIIDRELSKTGEGLDELLEKYEGKLKHEFHKKQVEKLFPNNKFDKTNIDTWDIQMLVGVLLLIFRKTLSDKEKEKLKEIKEIRNNILAHSPNASLSRGKYEAFQKQIQNAIKELASGFTSSVRIKCDEYITTSASRPPDFNLAIKYSQELKATDDKLQQILDESQNTGQDIKGRLESISEQIRRLDEKTLRGMDEIRREVGNIKIEMEKQRKSTDGHTEPSKTDRDIQKVQVLEDQIEQKINACRMVHSDIRKSLKPYHRSSYDEDQPSCRSSGGKEQPSYRSPDGKQTSAGNSQNKAFSFPEKTCVKPYVGGIHIVNISTDGRINQTRPFVVAIDIGTSFSGYAFSLNNKIIVPNWHYGQSFFSKTSTTILFHPNEEFDSFGFEAENKYAELVDDDLHQDWYFFRHFKMQLYAEQLTRTKELEAENGKKMDAIKVVSATIRYFYEKLIGELRPIIDRGISESDIHWVLTVPAIWTDSAKQFIRECAKNAGIERTHLLLVLESESASVWCQMGYEDNTNTIAMQPGTKYMVLDMGGGTVDTTVCENQDGMTINVLGKASSCAWGGTSVDKEFAQFFTGLIGQEVFSELCRKNKADHLELQRAIEIQKRNIGLKTVGMIFFGRSSLFEIFRYDTGKDFKEIVDESAYHEKVTYHRGKLKIDAHILKTFFSPCCENVVRHISDILKTWADIGIETLLLTGGFSKSEIMQNAVANAFPNLRVLVPAEPEEAVLKGAVILGNNPRRILERVMNYTYGIEITPLFDPSVHAIPRRVLVNGQYRCKNVFRKFIGIGESSTGLEGHCQEHAALFPYQEQMNINIYCSASSNPKYIDERDVQYIGRLTVPFPKREKSVVNVIMHFGARGLTATAVDLQNNNKISLTFNYLG